MSRSTKAPYFTEGYGTKNRKVQKRLANKRVRKKSTVDSKDMADGSYKKESNSWDIVDFKIKDSKAKRK